MDLRAGLHEYGEELLPCRGSNRERPASSESLYRLRFHAWAWDVIKVTSTLEQTVKAQRQSIGIALLFL